MSELLLRRSHALLGLLSLVNAPLFAAEACDPAAGQKVFEIKCSVCHALAENKVGPRLGDVVGRKAGSVDGFGYTPVLEGTGFKWDVEHLDVF